MSGRKRLRASCVAAFALTLATAGGASVPTRERLTAPPSIAPASLIAETGACQPGRLEDLLNEWLVAATEVEFASEYTAIAFDGFVEVLAILRDVAQDFCV